MIFAVLNYYLKKLPNKLLLEISIYFIKMEIVNNDNDNDDNSKKSIWFIYCLRITKIICLLFKQANEVLEKYKQPMIKQGDALRKIEMTLRGRTNVYVSAIKRRQELIHDTIYSLCGVSIVQMVCTGTVSN